MSTLTVEKCAFETSQSLSLKMVGNCYRPSGSELEPRGFTLVLTHCVGGHKEQWEPVIEELFNLQRSKAPVSRIREIWAFDWQSHGDSAVLNREVLKSKSRPVSAFDWTDALTSFVQSPRMIGHRIIPIGHSAGAAAVLLTTRHVHVYPALILVEPTIVNKEVYDSHLEDRTAQMDFVVTMTSKRRDSWSSRAQAHDYFIKRLPWALWDIRVVRLLVRHGLEDLPSGSFGLKCSKSDEASSYPDVEPHHQGARHLGTACSLMPIHIVWGARQDIVPEFIQNSLSDGLEGRHVASVTKVEDSGHMVVQERPTELARALSTILDSVNTEIPSGDVKSRL